MGPKWKNYNCLKIPPNVETKWELLTTIVWKFLNMWDQMENYNIVWKFLKVRDQLENKLHCSFVSPLHAEPTTKWPIKYTKKKKKKTQLTIVLGIDTKLMKRNTSAKTTKHVNMDEQQSEKWMNHLHYHLL